MIVDADWWFKNSDIKFRGKLTFSEDSGAYLTIYGSIEPFALLDISQAQPEDSREDVNQTEKICKGEGQDNIIFGKTKDGKKITLLYSILPSKNSVFRTSYSFEERTYPIKFIFVGTHFENLNEIQFESIIVEYSNLPYWITNHELGFTQDRFDENDNYILEHRYGKKVDVNIENRCSIQFFTRPEVNLDLVTNKKVIYHTYAKISSIGSKTLLECIILKNVLRDFFNFATTAEVRTVRMIGHRKVKFDNYEDIDLVEIFYRSSISKKMDKLKVIQPHLLRFSELDQKFFNVLKNWYSLRDQIGATYDLYFGVMYNSDLYLTNRFLMLAEGLEIFMGILSERIPDDELRRKIDRIDTVSKILDKCQGLENCELNEDDKNWISNIMNEKKSLSFREKMEKAYGNYSEILPKLSKVIGSKEEFAKAIQKSRNSLTHGNIDYDQLDTQELFWNMKDLELILQLCILSELGFTENELKDIYLIN